MPKIVFYFILGCFCFFLLVGTSLSSENMGSADIVLEGGPTGKVPFPHQRHQQALNRDCQSCHRLFPQELGVIAKLKLKNTLKKKAVMNNCQACHKDLASRGRLSGPTTCGKCHSR